MDKHIQNAIDTIYERVTDITIKKYIFPRLYTVYGNLFKTDESHVVLWSHELSDMPLRHLRFCFSVLDIIDNCAYQKYPPNVFEIKNMWKNVITSRVLHDEHVSFKCAVKKDWTANPCIFSAVQRTGVEFFQTERGGAKKREFFYHYIESVSDYVRNIDIPRLGVTNGLYEKLSFTNKDWLETLPVSQRDKAASILSEFESRKNMGECARDIAMSIIRSKRLRLPSLLKAVEK